MLLTAVDIFDSGTNSGTIGEGCARVRVRLDGNLKTFQWNRFLFTDWLWFRIARKREGRFHDPPVNLHVTY